MLPAAAIAKYRSVQVTTSSPESILLMLYNGVFRFLNEAKAAMAAHDRGRTSERIGKAHAILDELTVTLDQKSAPELCERLGSIYLFCMSRLVDASVKQDPEGIDDVLRILTPLKEAWATVAEEAARAK